MSNLTSIACPTVSTCMAIGHVATPMSAGPLTIISTSNGGTTWTTGSFPSSQVTFANDIACTSATACTVVGEATAGSGPGLALATTDGGSTWTTESTPTANDFVGISCPTIGACTAVGVQAGVSALGGAIIIGQAPTLPTTSVLFPSSGATLSGSTLLDASATNATSVEFRLFGGSYGLNAPVICTATPTYYGWLCSWNTTTVPNGSYFLASEAFGAGGSEFSSGVSVTISNPTTNVLFPSNGATLSGSTLLDASATNATSVEFRLFGGSYGLNAPVICTATPTYYGWLCSWNTTTVPNGSYFLASEAFGAAGSAFSSGVGVTISNPPSLIDLTGSFSGTTSWTPGTGGCSLIQQVFDATYPGSFAVGSVTLHLDGCLTALVIPPERFTYVGTFTFATSVGTIAGNASGAIYNAASSPSLLPDEVELTLSVLTGTGAFGGTAGTIHVSMQWPPPFGPPVTGSVTIP